jgi:CubicO group peptidase (beta-lactamase class C family)
MRMLLTDTSGIRDRYNTWGSIYSKRTLYFHGDSPISLGDFVRSYFVPGGSRYVESENSYARRPGADYSYSNLAVALAGYVAEAAGGTDFNALCKRRILHRLGMTDSGFRRSDVTTPNLAMPYHIDRETRRFLPYFQYGYPDYPDGALRTSAVNLATWLGAFMHFGKFRDVRVLERRTVEEIRRGQIPRIVPWQQGLVWYGVTTGKYMRMGHTGGDFGMSSRMFFRLDRKVGVVSLTNAYLSGRRWDAFRDIEIRLFDEFS